MSTLSACRRFYGDTTRTTHPTVFVASLGSRNWLILLGDDNGEYLPYCTEPGKARSDTDTVAALYPSKLDALRAVPEAAKAFYGTDVPPPPKPMTVTVTLNVKLTVDVKAWAAEYGTDPTKSAVRTDVVSYFNADDVAAALIPNHLQEIVEVTL